ncbi:MAG TPA: VWA domain-containing protein [Candidatus Binatia bacterium]
MVYQSKAQRMGPPEGYTNGVFALVKEIFSNIEFIRPAFLWLLFALPVIWLRFRDRSAVVLVWRSLLLLIVILVLADPERVIQQSHTEKPQEQIFALDLSRSISPAMRSWMQEMLAKQFVPGSQDRVLVFGSEVREVSDWADWMGKTPPRLTEIQPDRTNLEKLLTTAIGQSGGAKNLYLFTDGWETQGNVETVLPAITRSGVKIHPVLPSDRLGISDVAVSKLIAPSYGNSGEAANLKVVLENYNNRDVDGTLTLLRDGQPFKSESLKLKPGSHIYNYQTTLPDGPLTAYKVSFAPRQAELDTYAPDNQAFAWVTVRTKAKVLLINGQSAGGRYLEEILRRHGFNVTSRTADSAPPPNGYGLVIFNNVEREKLSTSYLAAVERNTADGNGFLMLGNEASFSPGSYRRTPIEALLPVEPREQKREERSHAVVLVIDKSGSMREDNRILYAQAAAKAVARQLKDTDSLGVVGFDISPFIVVPLEPVGRLRGSIDGQIDRLRPGGQTYFYPALLEAKRQLERSTATRKHVILLSDGETRGSQGELVDLISAMKNEMKITISSVAIGADADVRIMKRISQYGGGVFYQTLDPSTLPQIVLQELQDNPREEPTTQRDWTPVAERGSEILTAAQSYPSLRGYMDTDLKRGARLDLAILRDDRRAPAMASWRYGRGKAVAMTFDFEGRFSRNWIQWSGLPGFWDKVLEWLRPGQNQEPVPLHEARVSLAENQPVLDLSMFEESSGDSQFRFAIEGKGTRAEGTLRRLAPGHFQANLPIRIPGDYRISLVEDRHGRRITLPPLGYTLPQDLNAELTRPDFNVALLTKLADISGGEINSRDVTPPNPPQLSRSYTPLRQPLILLVVVLFLLEVGFRNLVISEPS